MMTILSHKALKHLRGGAHQIKDGSLAPLRDLPITWPRLESLGTRRAGSLGHKHQPGPKSSAPIRQDLAVLKAGVGGAGGRFPSPADYNAWPSQCHMSQRSKGIRSGGEDSWLLSLEAVLPHPPTLHCMTEPQFPTG